MNAAAVHDDWVKTLAAERKGAAKRSNETLRSCSEWRDAAVAWLQRVLPECCDQRGEPHARFLGAVVILHYALGEGNVRRDLVKERVQRLYPEAYAEVYGHERAAS